MFSAQQTDGIEVVFYTDPLCCWSWAFEPQWRKFSYLFRDTISVRYCMVGLIPSWKSFADSQNDISRPAQMGPIWMEASHISGMPIYNRIWMDNPPASSYLSCIAVKCAGLQSQNAELIFLRKLREAIMVKGSNIALQSVLLKVAEELADEQPESFSYKQFADDMANENGLAPFKADLQETQSFRINRFPTLIFRRPGQSPLMLTGHRSFISLLEVMERLGIPTDNLPTIDPVDYSNHWRSLMKREVAEISG